MSTRSAIRALLDKVSQFADVDVDDVVTSLWKGSVTLKNVRLRPEAFGSRSASLGLTGMSERLSLFVNCLVLVQIMLQNRERRLC